MIPIRDHNPSEKTPFVTYTIIAMNIVVFALMWPAYNTNQILEIYANWALVPAFISSGENWHGIFTSMFMHGGFMHIAGNMLFLWIYGDNLEDEMGHGRFLLFYIASGVAAGLAQYIAAPFSNVPMVGASGAIAGVMGGYLLLFPKARIDMLFIFIVIFKVIPIPAWLVLGFWFGLQIFGGIGASADAGGVAYLAHAGGFVAGVIITFPLWKRLGGVGFWSRTLGHPPHPEAVYTRTRIPTVTRRR